MKVLGHGSRTKVALFVLALGVASAGVGGTIYAQGVADQPIRNHVAEEKRMVAQEKHRAVQERVEQAKVRAEARVAEAKQRLEGRKLKACQEREQRIEATMNQMTKRGENHIAVFTKIADRVKAFYTEKGRTAENYDVLVAEVDAKKLAAEEAVAGAQSVSEVFSCDSDNPKIASMEFRDAHKAQVSALKEYRTAVKNLIVAVKSAQSTAEKAESTEGSTNE